MYPSPPAGIAVGIAPLRLNCVKSFLFWRLLTHMSDRKRKRSICCAIMLGLAALTASVPTFMAQNDPSSPKRDIDAVLRAHDKELLAITGVVGVYVGVQLFI